MIGSDESWVTLVKEDLNGWEAVVLARSIKRTLSTRKLTAVVSEHVSKSIKLLLRQEFNLVISYDESDLDGNGSPSLAKILLWNILPWKKSVFIESSSLVLLNSDEIFKYGEFTGLLELTSQKNNTQLFVMEPKVETYEKLIETAQKIGRSAKIEEVLDEYFGKVVNKEKKMSSSLYGVPITVDDKMEYGRENPKIVWFKDSPCKLKDKAKSDENQELFDNWQNTFCREVLPILNKIKKPETVSELEKSLSSLSLPPRNGPSVFESFTIPPELSSAIAIVGLSCRFPGSNNEDEFWDLLCSARDPIRTYPSNRPNSDECLGSEDLYFKAGFLSCPVDEFDAKFFGISPREAPFVDPQQRLLLEVTWEGLEDAGINPQTLKETDTGVFMGIWQQDYDRFLPNTGLSANDFHHRYLGNAFSATASRISYHLGLNGPALALESGCSSSMGAVHLSCESLRRGETSLCIASGVNLVLMVLNPLSGDDKDAVVLSSDHHCKTFDESADGFVRAEGCGVVILKRYADACRDGDRIHALIRGSALNNDGAGTSFGTPHAKAQERVIREALQNAGVAPHEVSYVEAHGTGTVVGDPTEMYAIGKVYSAQRKVPLLVSSVKSNIGHTEAAAGIAGLIKVILSMRNHTLPPHLHLKNLNPRINLDEIPAVIPTKITPWTAEKLIAGVSSFSMSGTNVHMIVQEAPKILTPGLKSEKYDFSLVQNAQKLQLVTLSAKSEEALEELENKYVDFLQKSENLNLEQFAFSTNTGRAHFSCREAIIAKDVNQLINKLTNKRFVKGKVPANSQKIAFLFTGQGSQYFKMGQDLYELYPSFKTAFDKIDKLFRQHLGESLKKVVWEDSKLLEKTIFCQPAIFSIQYCLLELWKSFGISPETVIGHSVGEFCAAVAAGVLSLEDSMKLVVERSKLVSTISSGSMMAVKDSYENVSLLIDKFKKENNELWIDVAAINSAEEVVVSGSAQSVSKFSELCLNSSNTKTQIIPASHAFHSRDMDPVLAKFKKVSETIKINRPKCNYVSGTLARVMSEEEFGPEYWTRHLRDTVRFKDAIATVWADNKILVEIGAQPILLSLTMANVPDSHMGTFCPSLRKSEEGQISILTSLSKIYISGSEINWKNWFSSQTTKINLPHYPFQRQKFWYVNEDSALGGPNLRTKLIHPLLGRQLPFPLAETIFCHNLKLKDVPWVEDHKVAERVIVPAAAYLESILAAGREVLHTSGIQVPLTVENLTVEAALELNKPCSLQIVVSSIPVEDGIQYSIGVHRQLVLDQADKWRRHAHGHFSSSIKVPQLETINISELQNKLILREAIDKAYEKIGQIGIQFGPKFQSIKRAWSSDSEILTEIMLPSDYASYVCHPIILDAMIQTFAFRTALSSNEKEDKEIDLQLPIGIKKFIWLSSEPTSKLYAYTNYKEGEDGNVSLFTENGENLGFMEGLELLKTSVDSFIRSLTTDTAGLPDFYNEIWRPNLGVTGNRVDLSQIGSATSETKFTSETHKKIQNYEENEWKGHKIMNNTMTSSLFKSMQECGLNWPEVGKKVYVSDWANLLSRGIMYEKIARIHFDILSKKRYIDLDESELFGIVLKPLPPIDELEKIIRTEFDAADKILSGDVSVGFFKRLSELSTMVFQGKMTPLELMFPEDKNEIGAYKFYTDSKFYQLNTQLIISSITDILLPYAEKGKGKVRILEVGAGTGATTVQIIKKLEEEGIDFHYTFTDISPLFLSEAKSKLPSDVSISLLNIEEDPLSQGFAPEEFDLILGCQVFHAIQDLCDTFKNVRKLLKLGGKLVIMDQFFATFSLNLSFGLVDGWWRFNDFRKLSPIIEGKEWADCLVKTGYKDVYYLEEFEKTFGLVISTKNEQNDIMYKSPIETKKIWVLFEDDSQLSQLIVEKLNKYGIDVKIVSLDYSDSVILPSSNNKVILNGSSSESINKYFESLEEFCIESVIYMWTLPEPEPDVQNEQKNICAGLLYILQSLQKYGTKHKTKARFNFISRGVYYIGDQKSGNPSPATAIGVLRSYGNENPELSTKCIDVDQDNLDPEKEVTEVLNQLFKKDKEIGVAFREGKKFLLRFNKREKFGNPLNLPNSDRFKLLNPPRPIAFSELEVIPTTKEEVIEDFVEVRIHASALNFRDLFVIMKPDGFILPTDVPVSVGLDISGIVSAVGPDVKNYAVGDEVFGFAQHGGICSHAIISSKLLMKKPSSMSFESAATIPCVFLTSFYSLIVLAKMKREDRVLIHVGSGGVGLSAIQIAQHIGAEIYTTAGSKQKRKYLQNLGIKHIYHSRNTDYGKEIMRDTGGKGITIVLNSLTGPNFKEETLATCAPGARFVEIAKLNIWSEEEVKKLRPDVEYTILDLSLMAFRTPDEAKLYMKDIEKMFDDGYYKPLPCITYPLEQVRDAYHHMQEAKHIGKIVVKIPIPSISPDGRLSLIHHLFNPQSTYLITGGLGGLGMETCKWMTRNGAKNIVLVGRNSPKVKALELINNLNLGGSRIHVMQCDVGDYEQISNLLQLLPLLGLPQLKGIIHAAGVISDSIVSNQSWDKFNDVFRPKVYGAWHLHNLTSHMDLEFFVVFSSGVSFLGVMGQCNHTGGNKYLDSLTNYRLSLGLKSTSINWGAWSDVGAAAHIKVGHEGALGMRAFTPSRGISALEKILRENITHTGAIDISDWNVLKQFVGGLGNYLDEIKYDKGKGETLSEEFNKMIEEIKASDPELRQEKIQKFLEAILKQTLRIPESEKIDPDQNFTELGVDSLMAMEMRNRLQGMLEEKTLTVSALQENRTLRSLSTHIANLMNSDSSPTLPLPELLKNDAILPPEIKAQENENIVKPSEFKHILLTGVTGHLAPHFIPELLAINPQLSIHCLIRAKNQGEANERLDSVLRRYDLVDKVPRDKIVAIPGDVSKDNLGLLENETYVDLSKRLDAIVHCAIKSNHVVTYEEGGAMSMRSQNVIGLLNLLKLCTNIRTKHFLYASSLVAVTKAEEDNSLSEEYPDADDMGENIFNGYVMSKFISEKLLSEAGKRGVPVTVIRYASIFGNSLTGALPIGTNHAWSILLACIRVRKFPNFDQNGLPLMCVDTAAKLSAKLFLNDGAERGVYNLTSSSQTTEEDIKQVFEKFGISGEFIPFKEWRDEVFEEFDKNELGPFSYLYEDEGSQPRYLQFHPLASSVSQLEFNSISKKTARNFPDVEDFILPARLVLERHMAHYFKNIHKDT